MATRTVPGPDGVSDPGSRGYARRMPDTPERDAPTPEDVERAEEIAEEVGAENPDPQTRREAIELELEDEGISDAGAAVGEHND